MKLTVSTTVDQQTGQEQYSQVQYSKIIDSGATVHELLCWATNVHKKYSIHKLGADYFADVWDVKIGKVEE